ncbi:MFS transporter [Caenimonas koreensis DSM 17982]|uniref:MFS transporter n=1 Tax=Caenimonas koreensis DSM 17982 TaxID=1121255 RepID=A0A844AZF1_9BURK|nr:MFS transporter [Caenimonas koreensis DSM 17982]
MRLWVSRIFGGAAGQMVMVATAWQMYDLTGSAWDLGLVGLYQFAPVVLLTFFAGHVADRYHRARVSAFATALQLINAVVLLAATYKGFVSRELLLGVSVMLGAARTFQMPANQSLVPSLVPPAMLPRAMALSSAGFQVAVIGGPALAGLVFAVSPVSVYAVALLCLLVSLVLVSQVQYDHRTAGHSMTLDSMFAGLRFVWTRKQLLGAVSLDLMAVLFGGAVALLPIYAKDILQVGPAGLGVLRSAPAVGALCMSVLLAHFPITRRIGRTLLLSVAAYGVCMLAFGISTNFYLSLAALAISGSFDTVSVVVRQTLVQLDTPDDMRGRVGAVNSVFIGASNQLGEFESGATAALLGPVGSVLLGGCGTLAVVALWWKLFPALARRDSFR